MSRAENLLLALCNLCAYFPFWVAVQAGRPCVAAALAMHTTASIQYYLSSEPCPFTPMLWESTGEPVMEVHQVTGALCFAWAYWRSRQLEWPRSAVLNWSLVVTFSVLSNMFGTQTLLYFVTRALSHLCSFRLFYCLAERGEKRMK